MKKQNQIFYIVEGSLYRNLEKTDKETIEIRRVFKSANSYTDRLNAFRYYQNFVDVLLQSNYKMYKDHYQAQEDLANFYNSGVMEEHPMLKGIFIDNDFGKMLSISFCTVEETPYITKKGDVLYDHKRIIHGLGYKSDELIDIFQRNLAIESYLFNKYGIIKGEETEISKAFLSNTSKKLFFDKFSNELDDLLDKWYHKLINQGYEDVLLLSKIKIAYEELVMSSYPQEQWQDFFKDQKSNLKDYRDYQKEREAFRYFTKSEEVKIMSTPLFQ